MRVLDDKDLRIVDQGGRINSLEILAKRYRQALEKICDPKRCGWSAAEMFSIAENALLGRASDGGGE